LIFHNPMYPPQLVENPKDFLLYMEFQTSMFEFADGAIQSRLRQPVSRSASKVRPPDFRGNDQERSKLGHAALHEGHGRHGQPRLDQPLTGNHLRSRM
jgi:hypothetical protein